MDIEELQEKVIDYRNQRDWAKYHNPKDLAISLSLEAGELLEIFQWKSQDEVELIRTDPKQRQRVKEELGDIFIYALTMAHEFGFDPAEVILEKVEINDKKYPVEKARGRADKYTAY
ncbi:MAG: nucleotide pyrophosphohydrolase [Deltaproteobacteria bacterium]|nr:MAG: nucleotide pyrophosphohydrolase [Deltaproteobacteria bacterium]